MLHENSTSAILDLPPEIIVKIFMKLPYTDIVSIRLTCRAFNEAGMYVQMTALRKMRIKTDSAFTRSHVGLQNNNDTGALRTLKGTASVKCLWEIIRVVDASTFHLILDGTLPPAPAALLADVEKALNLAVKKNPIMGRDHLKRTVSGLINFFTMAMNSLDSSLETGSVFRTATDLLASLPIETYNVAQTAYGLHCLVCLHSLTEMVNDWPTGGHSVITAPLLIQILAKLSFRGMQEFICINAENSFAEEIQVVDPTIDLIELMIGCSPEVSVDVNSLEQICRLEPTDFKISLHDVASAPWHYPRDLDLSGLSIRFGPLQGARIYTYCTPSSHFLEGLDYMNANNPVSNL